MNDHEDNGSDPSLLSTFTYVFRKDNSHCCGKENGCDQFGNDLQNIIPVRVRAQQLRTTVSFRGERLDRNRLRETTPPPTIII